MKRIVHYIYDPLCGWCYAAEKLTDAVSASAQGKFEVQLHAGGLFSQMHLSNAKRANIRAADARISQLTGQPFGDAYLNGLLGDPEVIYDSFGPIVAILAAEQIKPGSDLKMLKALQTAHYLHGQHIGKRVTIADVAEGLGFDKAEFSAAVDRINEAQLHKHLDATQKIMREVHASGFPTFVAQIGDQLAILPHGGYYGDPEGFAAMVTSILAPHPLA